jgi:CheY-like chemotaxis protein
MSSATATRAVSRDNIKQRAMIGGAMSHTVLVVEDEEDLREMMREALELSGYVVATARDGDAALEELRRIDHLCLVLLDLLMPGMNGWDFFAEVRQRPDLAAVPIVVHSSAGGHAPEGATRVLQKPVSFERLISVVKEYCEPS